MARRRRSQTKRTQRTRREAPPDTWGARLLALAGPHGPDGGWRSNLYWFRAFLLMHMGARSFLTFPSGDAPWVQAVYAAAIGTALLGLVPELTRRLVPLAAGLVFLQLGARLTGSLDTANHVFLEGVMFAFLALCRVEDRAESELLLGTLRWTIAIFFFWTGAQKLIYGYYFDGQYLLYMAAVSERFELVFRPLIPAEDLDRLQAFNGPPRTEIKSTPVVGAGPYRTDSVLFVALSNAVYLFEMGAGILLLVPRIRAWVAVAAVGFVLAIEAGARELTFGALMINLLLLFTDGPWIRRLLPAFAVGYAYLLLAERGGLGLLPMFWYVPA